MYDGIVQDLIDEFGRLPGIGPKSAQRIAFHILQTETFDVTRLAELLLRGARQGAVLRDLRQRLRAGALRDLPRPAPQSATVICVVEEAKDVVAIERTREFRGLYHVLGGAISPIDGIGPDDLRIRQLLAAPRRRHRPGGDPRHRPEPRGRGDGDLPVSRLLRTIEIRVTRLASGLPVGGDLEYADEVTLGRAFEGRRLVEH